MIRTKEGKDLAVGKGKPYASVKEEPDRFVLVSPNSKLDLIPLSEVSLVSIRAHQCRGHVFRHRGNDRPRRPGSDGDPLGDCLGLEGILPVHLFLRRAAIRFRRRAVRGRNLWGLQRTEWCTLEHLNAVNGLYRIKITNEVDETQNTDELKLLVVDHPPAIRPIPDEQGGIHTVVNPVAPLSARDGKGRDILPLVQSEDGTFWQTRIEEKDPTILPT